MHTSCVLTPWTPPYALFKLDQLSTTHIPPLPPSLHHVTTGPKSAVPFLGGIVEMVKDPYGFWERQRLYATTGLSWNSIIGRFTVFVTDPHLVRHVFSFNSDDTLLLDLHPSSKVYDITSAQTDVGLRICLQPNLVCVWKLYGQHLFVCAEPMLRHLLINRQVFGRVIYVHVQLQGISRTKYSCWR